MFVETQDFASQVPKGWGVMIAYNRIKNPDTQYNRIVNPIERENPIEQE